MPIRPGSLAPIDTSPLPQVHLARDYPASVVRSKLKSKTWLRVRPGAFVSRAVLPEDRFDRERFIELARVGALRRQLRLAFVFSHVTAALVWGLPLLETPGAAHIIQRSRPGPRGTSDVVRHFTELGEREVTTRRGVRTTSLERSVLDATSLLNTGAALVVTDGALRSGLDVASCTDLLEARRGRHGVPRSRAVLRYGDAGAESAGESLTRFSVLLAGLPEPETQIRIETSEGVYWGDMGWRDKRVLLEYDGRIKYTRSGDAADAVYREKRREDAIRAAGWIVIRVSWDDLRRPASFIRRLREALGNPALVSRPELRG